MRPEPPYLRWRAGFQRLQARLHRLFADLPTLVPPALRNWYRGQGQLLLATLDGQRLRLTPARPESSTRIVETDLTGLDSAQRKAAVTRTLAGLGEAENQRIFLCLPPRRALRRQLSLPLAVAEDLRQAILFELDRQTPFRPEQVYFDYRVIEREGAAASRQTLCIELTVVPRVVVDEQVRQAAALGLPVAAAVLERDVLSDGEDCPNFLPNALNAARPEKRRRINRRFFALALTLALAAVAVPVIMKQRAVAALDQALRETRPAALQAGALREQLTQVVEENNFLVTRRLPRPPMVFVVEQLSRALPDDSWASLLEIEDTTLRLQGESDFPGQLPAALLESTGIVTGVRLRSAGPASRGTGFELSGQLRHAPPEAPPLPGTPAPRPAPATGAAP